MLRSFTGSSDGTEPQGGLVLSRNLLFGTTSYGGTGGDGTIFAINTDGSGFRILHSFTTIPPDGPLTNSDGAQPRPSLILSANTLYGTAEFGGTWGNGTVFALNTDGIGFTILHSFALDSTDGRHLRAGFDYSGYALESTTDLGSPSWISDLPPSVTVNGRKTVTIPVQDAQQFFRLRR